MPSKNERKIESTEDFIQQSRKIQNKIESANKELLDAVVVGSGGDDLVKITLKVSGYSVQKVELNPSFVHRSKEHLESSIELALRDAMKKAEEVIKKKINSPFES